MEPKVGEGGRLCGPQRGARQGGADIGQDVWGKAQPFGRVKKGGFWAAQNWGGFVSNVGQNNRGGQPSGF